MTNRISPDHKHSKDGSSTLFSEQFEQFYHNPNGALSESLHVFFESSNLFEVLGSAQKETAIFETGFGTGLNFLLLADYCLKNPPTKRVSYTSIEAFPLNTDVASQLNYAQEIGNSDLKDVLPTIFAQLEPGINKFQPFDSIPLYLTVYFGEFETFPGAQQEFDFFFHDPFSPEVNEELWTVETFNRLHEFGTENAFLNTYCAASKARAAMSKAGWFVARAKGALGKREMTVASKNADQLLRFKRVNEQRLIQRLDNGDFS